LFTVYFLTPNSENILSHGMGDLRQVRMSFNLLKKLFAASYWNCNSKQNSHGRPRLHSTQPSKMLCWLYLFSGTAVAFGVLGCYITLPKISPRSFGAPYARRPETYVPPVPPFATPLAAEQRFISF